MFVAWSTGAQLIIFFCFRFSVVLFDRPGNDKIKKKLNHLGTDRRVLLCSSCGSYRHLLAECPESSDNHDLVHQRDIIQFLITRVT